MIRRTLKKNDGITGMDLVISVIVLTLFIGILTSLMGNLYKTSIEIQTSAVAMAYATAVSEKIDEKSFEEVNSNTNFVDYLVNNGEIEIDEKYTVTVIVSPVDGVDQNYVKNIKVVVTYKPLKEAKVISFTKLKIKEVAEK